MKQLCQISIALAALLGLAGAPSSLRAATLGVTSTADSGAGTLRAALAGAANGDRIDITATGVITLTSGELLVARNVAIAGPGPASLAINGNHASRVFHVGSNTVVTIAGLTITAGFDFGEFPTGAGGGIYNDHAALIVSNCAVSGNSARFGGGIYNDGRGAVSGSVKILNSALNGNSAIEFAAGGGGIYNDGSGGSASFQIFSSTLSGNAAYFTGGAIRNFASGGTASMEIFNSTLNGNSALNSAGGIANNSFSGGIVSLKLANCTLSGNSAGGGGGIYTSASSGSSAISRIQNSTLTGNRADTAGGGIYNAGSGASVEIGSTILNNATSDDFSKNIYNFNNSGTITSLGFNLSSDDDSSIFLTAIGDQVNTDPMLGPLQDNGGPTFTHALLGCSPAIDKGTNFSGAPFDQRGVGFVRAFDIPAVPTGTGGGTDIGAFEVQRFTVLNANDSGPGSLRQAVLDANAHPGLDVIAFALCPPGRILLTSGELLFTGDLILHGPGPGNLAVDGNAASRVFHIGSNTVVTISGLTITNGRSGGSFPLNSGGGILNDHATLTVSNSVISGNSARFSGGAGGGIYNYSEGGTASVKVVNSVLSRNSATHGGGVFNDGNPSHFPPGPPGTATLQILNTTLRENTADGYGGAIMNAGYHGSASAEIVSSTLSSNSARLLAGGIMNQNESAYGGGLRIVNSTMSGNFGNFGGRGFAGGIYTDGDMQIHNSTLNGDRIFNDSRLEIGSTIVNGSIDDNRGTITSLGYNLINDPGGSTGFYFTDTTDQVDTDPLLGPLQDNGGPTFTHALSCGSQAIDKGKNLSASATDQRGGGFVRTFDNPGVPSATGGDGTDIGAFESTIVGFIVVNTNDSGPGSLRQAIEDANAHPGLDSIEFASSAYGTILLTSDQLLITDELCIMGPGATNVFVDGNGARRQFQIQIQAGADKTVSISGLTLTNGSNPGGLGGAIYNDGRLVNSTLIVANCVLSGNSADSGGAIYNDLATLTVSNCTLSSNSAGSLSDFGGGGIMNAGYPGGTASVYIVNSTLIGNSAEFGGGIANGGQSSGAILTIFNSTLSGNSAHYGGGIYNALARLRMSNSTLSGNSSRGGGGGIYNNGDGGNASGRPASLEIQNCTLSGNSGLAGGGIFNYGRAGDAELVIGNTILNAGASGETISNGNGAGAVTSLGYNLSSDAAAGLLTSTGDLIHTDPRLGPLQDNGGPTFTHALTCRSPAVDAGKNFAGSPADQRGAARTFDDPTATEVTGGDGTDIGAFEAQQTLPVCDLPPVADATATPPLVISPNGANATVILDGSRSSDPDGDLLQYNWYEGDSLLAGGVVATALLQVGTHEIQLVADDGTLTDTDSVAIEVITAAEAVQRLMDLASSGAAHSQPLRATLAAAIASIDRSNPTAAINQLLAFQNKVRAQVAPLDAALADAFIQAAQEVIDALSGGNTNPGGHPHGRFTSMTRHSSGRVQMKFLGEPGLRYIVEATTNFPAWEQIGVATSGPDGSFTFEDTQSARFQSRLYRARLP